MTSRTKKTELEFYVSDPDNANTYGPFADRHEATAFARENLGAHWTVVGSDPSKPLKTTGRAKP